MGLGGVSVASDYPEVSRDELERILNSLKKRFQDNLNCCTLVEI